MMRPFLFAGGTAVVTGAASGIGEALAHALAARGSHLVLVDCDAERLAGVAGHLRAADPRRKVDSYVVELADDEATRALGAALAAEHGEITLLVNNAGVALRGRFDQVTLEEFDWVLGVNFRAQVRLTHALLPTLMAHPGAHLVNVSSVFGIVAPPGQVAYSASKFAVRGFTEAVRHELAAAGVGVTVVHPASIRTCFEENARLSSGVEPAQRRQHQRRSTCMLSMSPESAAAEIVAAVEHRRPRLLIGWKAKLPDAVARLLPGSYWRIVGRGAGRRA